MTIQGFGDLPPTGIQGGGPIAQLPTGTAPLSWSIDRAPNARPLRRRARAVIAHLGWPAVSIGPPGRPVTTNSQNQPFSYGSRVKHRLQNRFIKSSRPESYCSAATEPSRDTSATNAGPRAGDLPARICLFARRNGWRLRKRRHAKREKRRVGVGRGRVRGCVHAGRCASPSSLEPGSKAGRSVRPARGGHRRPPRRRRNRLAHRRRDWSSSRPAVRDVLDVQVGAGGQNPCRRRPRRALPHTGGGVRRKRSPRTRAHDTGKPCRRSPERRDIGWRNRHQ